MVAHSSNTSNTNEYSTFPLPLSLSLSLSLSPPLPIQNEGLYLQMKCSTRFLSHTYVRRLTSPVDTGLYTYATPWLPACQLVPVAETPTEEPPSPHLAF